MFLEEIWTPTDNEFLNRWLNESLTTSKLTDDEKRLIDGEYILGVFEGCCNVPNGFSGNGRYYDKSCFFNEEGAIVDPRIVEKVSSKTLFGSIGHEDKEIDDEDVRNGKHAFITYKYWFDPKSQLGMARHLMLNTKAGWNLYSPMRAGAEFKMSSRASGEFIKGKVVTHPETKAQYSPVDPKTYRLFNYDTVLIPGLSQTSANIISESANNQKNEEYSIIEVRSKDNNMELEKLLETSQNKLNESLVENVKLVNENSTLKETVVSLESKVLSFNESLRSKLSKFSESDLEMLLSTRKAVFLGESKETSYNNKDSVFTAIDLPVLNESVLRSEVIRLSNLFESLPSDVSIISKVDNPAYGSNGFVLGWSLGNRPKNVLDSVSRFVNESHLFEGCAKKSKNESDDMDSDDENETDDMDEAVSLKKKKNESKMSKDDVQELNEWRTLTGTNAPKEYIKEVKIIAENLKEISDTFGSKQAIQEKLDVLETGVETYQALGSVDDFAKYKSICEDLTNELGDPELVFEELKGAKQTYSMIVEKFGSLSEAEEQLIKAKEHIISLNEALKSKVSTTEQKPNLNENLDFKAPETNVQLNEDAERISNELKGALSMSETLEIINSFKGDLNKAEESVFRFLRESKEVPEVKPEQKPNLNESFDPIGKKIREEGQKIRGGSYLANYYDNLSI